MKNRKRFLKAAGIFLAVIVFCFVAGSFLFSYAAKKKIRDAQPGNFRLTSEKIETSLLRRQITIIDGELSQSRFSAAAAEATISGISFFQLLLGNQFLIKDFSVSEPVVHIFKNENTSTAITPRNDSSAKSRTIRVKQIEIPDAQLFYLREDTDNPDTIFSAAVDVEIKDFTTGTTSVQYLSSEFGFDQCSIIAEKGDLKVKDGMYNLRFGHVAFDTNNPDLTVSEIEFVSPHSRYEIGRRAGAEIDWYNLQIDTIQLNEINVDALVQDTVLVYNKTILKNLNAEIFRDKKLPFPEKPDTKIPSELVNSAPIGWFNDTLVISNAAIKYEERGENAEEAGTITFDNLQAEFFNLGNIDTLGNEPIRGSAQAKVMDAALLDVDFVFTDPKSRNPSQVTGTLASTPLSIFNPMVTPYLGVNIQSGGLRELAFNFGYKNNRATGDMIFEYDNLDFVMLSNENTKRMVLSFVASTFVVKQQNIEGNEDYRKGEIAFERNKKKSIFNYWWKSLQSGMKDVAVAI